MEQRNRTHFQNFMAKLENFREEEIQVLEEYLEPVFGVREKIVSSFSEEKASSRFSVGEISDAMFYYNPDEPNKGCVVIEKIISLSDEDFWFFGENIKQEASFITDNEELQYFDQQMTLHCLFIQKEDAEFGVLISHDKKSGEVYSGYLPNLDQFQEIGCEISEKENCMEPQM